MTVPIPYGYNFKVNHKKKDNHYSMAQATTYGNSFAVGYMISGDRMIITPDRTVFVHPGTVQFMHKNLCHRTTYISDGIYENVGIKFRESVVPKIVAAIGQENFDTLYNQISVTLTPEAYAEIGQIVSLIEQEWNHYDEYSDAVIEGLVIRFFITALRGQTAFSDKDIVLKEKHSPLIQALTFIQHSYTRDPSLQETADAAHVSAAHLSRLFKSELDTSYSNFLTEVKLTHAMNMLLNTNLPISEIAERCGYQNGNYFCDVFKKQIGMSPLQYRKSQNVSDNCPHLPILPKDVNA